MKKRVCLLLVVFVAAGMFACCGRAETPVTVTKEEPNLTNEVTNEITTAEDITTVVSTADALTKTEPATYEAVSEDWADWQKKALAVMQSVEVKYVPELTGINFTLQDISQDGVPEIIEDLFYIEWYDGPEAIWTWYNGNYECAYLADDDHQIESIQA